MKTKVMMLMLAMMVGVASVSAEQVKQAKQVKMDKCSKMDARCMQLAKRLQMDEKQTAELQKVFAQNMADMQAVRVKCQARIDKVLTAEQREQLAAMRAKRGEQMTQGGKHGKMEHRKMHHGHHMQHKAKVERTQID